MPKYEDTAVLFIEKNPQDRRPNMTGKAVLSKAMIDYLLTEYERGNEPTVRIAFWEKSGKKGPFYSGRVSEASIPERGEQGNTQHTVKTSPPLDDEIPF